MAVVDGEEAYFKYHAPVEQAGSFPRSEEHVTSYSEEGIRSEAAELRASKASTTLK